MAQTLAAVGFLDMRAEVQCGAAPCVLDLMLERFERGKPAQWITLALLVGCVPAGHLIDAENLIRFGTVAAGADASFQAATIQRNRVGILAEQIDRRRAVQMQVTGTQANIGRHGSTELKLETQAGGADIRPNVTQPRQAEKMETLREHKVFLQDPIAVEHIARVGQQCLVGGEPGEANILGRQAIVLAIDVQRDAV